MINNTKKIKELYENIQRKLFNIVPGKWDELYLYASIIERLGKVQVGEMYFYFMPRGILKRKFINAGNVIAINELSKNRRQVTKSSGDSHPVSVFGYEFLLRVSDANALRNLIKNGVGRSKSYGAGMSLVMGVEKQKK